MFVSPISMELPAFVDGSPIITWKSTLAWAEIILKSLADLGDVLGLMVSSHRSTNGIKLSTNKLNENLTGSREHGES